MENKKTEIDIILPNYNSSEFIDETIQSVLNQNFKNWKLIIIDDCSDLKTRKKIKEYEKLKKIKVFWLKKNKGAAYCRNFAITRSKSKYLKAARGETKDIAASKNLTLFYKFFSFLRFVGVATFLAKLAIKLNFYPSILYTVRK